MNAPANDKEDHGEVFLDENDFIQEITVDKEGLPDVDGEGGSDAEAIVVYLLEVVSGEAGDSIRIFSVHTYLLASN
ncbi:unnamed protein product [Ilex paraguariensis]|uniref:Uncharacterized protein n=1 Tax=Ilex paraguariensis TaxID=185542 RepID=A0ABC8U274_9AQUA